MERLENAFIEQVEITDELNDFIINIDEFDFEDDEINFSKEGAEETVRQLEEDLKLETTSRALAIAREMALKEQEEKNRKKERERLYKTDKKCYNNIKYDKKCQECEKVDKTDNRIFTYVNIRKIKKLLRYEGITYKELAKVLEISERTLNRKMNVYIDLEANELIAISKLLNVDINELIYTNKH